MRAAAGLLLLVGTGAAAAPPVALDACLERLAADARFAPIARKIALGLQPESPAAVPPDLAVPDRRERAIVAQWTAARSDCVMAEATQGNPAYRPPLQLFRLEAENAIIEAAADLHDGVLSYAAFNRRRQAIERERRERVAGLSRQIQAQRAAQEQSDQLARERQLLQRGLEDAERQSAQAQQQAARAQQEAETARRSGAGGYPPYRARAAAPPILPYSNCFRLGARVVCTYR